MKCPERIRSILFLASSLSTVSFWGLFTTECIFGKPDVRQASDLSNASDDHPPSFRQRQNGATIYREKNESHSPISKEKKKSLQGNTTEAERVGAHLLRISTVRSNNVVKSHKEYPNLFDAAPELSLTPLRSVDREFYTIRVNTWQRHNQLLASIEHHSKCDGVAQIQVIWKEPGDPPKQVMENPKVVIERHDENKLNQRFNVLIPTPTLGILSIDDDVLYPCEAADMAFHAWTKNPDRQVGFDRRRNRVKEDGKWEVRHKKAQPWSSLGFCIDIGFLLPFSLRQYGFGRLTSITLTKYSFQHRDYLDWYTKYLPREIYDQIDETFNCEDIAMSLMISALTGGKAPIIVDDSVKALELELLSSNRISRKRGHYRSRSVCVDTFSSILGLKTGPYPLQPSANTTADIIHSIDSLSVARHVTLAKKYDSLIRSNQLESYREQLRLTMMTIPKQLGLNYTMVNIPGCYAC